MISEIHSFMIPNKVEKLKLNNNSMNYQQAGIELKNIHKHILEVNLELKQIRFNSITKEKIDSFDENLIDDEMIEMQVKEAIMDIMDKHGRLNDRKL